VVRQSINVTHSTQKVNDHAIASSLVMWDNPIDHEIHKRLTFPVVSISVYCGLSSLFVWSAIANFNKSSTVE